MPSSPPLRWILVPLCLGLAGYGCAGTETQQGESGSLSLDLVLAGGVEIDVVDWQITGNDMNMGGAIDVSAPGSTASVEVFGLPVGAEPYVVELSAVSADQEVTCRGSAEFDVEVGVSTQVMVMLNCKRQDQLGAVRVNGKFNICSELTKVVVSPLQTSVGNDISLLSAAVDEEGDPISYMWSSHSGSLADPTAASTSYTCTEVGDDDITILVSDDGGSYCMSMWTVRVTCVDGDGGTGGSGGAGGAGGMGGAQTGTATVTAAHFAPEVPTAEDTAVAIYVNGDEVTALGTIEYGQTTGRVELPAPATYDIGVGLPGGDGPLLQLSGVQLNDGDDIAAAAYRTNDELPVALFAYNLSTSGLEGGSGRVFVSHGANDEALNPVDIIVTDEGACPPPLLDDLAFGETRVEGGLDLPATTYNLGFDLDPGDCEAEVPFGAPVTEAVTTVLVAVDEDVGEGLAPQVWALVDAEIVVALITPDLCEGAVCEDTGDDCTVAACNPGTGLCETSNVQNGTECNAGGAGTCQEGVCVPNPECVVDVDCPDTGNECIDAVCNAGTCGTSNNTNACEGDTGTCQEGVCVPNPECVVDVDCPDTGNECIEAVCNAGTCETSNNSNACDGGTGTCNAGVCEPNASCEYTQDFESLVSGDPPQAQPTSLATDGWLVGANVFAPDGSTFLYDYFAFPAPNGGPAFSAVAAGEGGATQGAQQLSIYNDYNNADHAAGNIIEAIVFRERTIAASDVGTTLSFTFDAKAGNIEGASTALAFIKTLNPAAGFATTNFITEDTTNLPATWSTFTLSLAIDASLVGQTLQYGGQSRASNFEGSGIFYDNMDVCSVVTVQ